MRMGEGVLAVRMGEGVLAMRMGGGGTGHESTLLYTILLLPSLSSSPTSSRLILHPEQIIIK